MSLINSLTKSYQESEKGLNEEFEGLHTEIKDQFIKGSKCLSINSIPSTKVVERLTEKGFTLVTPRISSSYLNFPDEAKYGPFQTLNEEYKSVTGKLEAGAKDGETFIKVDTLDIAIEKHLKDQGLVVKPQKYNVGAKCEDHPKKRDISFM